VNRSKATCFVESSQKNNGEQISELTAPAREELRETREDPRLRRRGRAQAPVPHGRQAQPGALSAHERTTIEQQIQAAANTETIIERFEQHSQTQFTEVLGDMDQ
jgi:hypothetical protein